MVGAANTVTVRLSVGEGGPATGVWVVVTPLVAFGFVPGVELVTSKMTVQLPAVGMVMPVKLSAVAPAARVVGVVPTHVPVTFPATAAILTSVSVKLAPVKALAFELESVSVMVDVPPDWIEVGLKVFAIVGCGGTPTVTLLSLALIGPTLVTLLGSTLSVLPTLVYMKLLPFGVALNCTTKLAAGLPLLPKMTSPPLDVQVSRLLTMPQLIVPTPFTLTALN